MILLAVLGAIGIIYIMIVQMSADAVFTANYYSTILFQEKSYYMCKSANTFVSQIFTLDDEKYDCMNDQWAQVLPPYHLEEEQVYLTATIEDQDRFFNPNAMMGDSDQPDEKHVNQFRKILETIQVNPDLANAVLDWMDKDGERRLPGGEDGIDYEDVPPKGGSLDSLDEFRLIKGFAKEDFQPKVVNGRALPGLMELMSVYTSGKININTTRSELILSLDDEMTEEMTAEIIRRRGEKPFETMDDLLDLPGVSHDLLYRLKQLADVKSDYYKIRIIAQDYSRTTSGLTVIVKRSGKSTSTVYWQAE